MPRKKNREKKNPYGICPTCQREQIPVMKTTGIIPDLKGLRIVNIRLSCGCIMKAPGETVIGKRGY